MNVIKNLLAGLLEPAERESVLGDLAEQGANSSEAIRELCDLAFRRQTAMWFGWRPCAALLFLIVPFSVILTLQPRRTILPAAMLSLLVLLLAECVVRRRAARSILWTTAILGLSSLFAAVPTGWAPISANAWLQLLEAAADCLIAYWIAQATARLKEKTA